MTVFFRNGKVVDFLQFDFYKSFPVFNIADIAIVIGVGLLILYSIITIVKNIIEPKIIGKQIGLHPLIALICVFSGLKIFGFIGIFLLPFSVMFAYKLFNEGVFELLFSEK